MTDKSTGQMNGHQAQQTTWNHPVALGLLVALLLFITSMIGTWTRPLGHLAALWPANAVLLGLMVRFPRLARPAGWIAATAGYLAAGYVSGDPWRENILLTLGNLVGVVSGYLVYARLSVQDRSLAGPGSVLKMIGIVTLASASAALLGSIIDPLIFGGRPVGGALKWFLVEAVNYFALLPVLLTIPTAFRFQPSRRWRSNRWQQFLGIAPLGLLAILFVLGVRVGGPGAITYPILALIWCALVYGLFATSILTLLYSAWTLLSISTGLLHVSAASNPDQVLTSVRLGVTLIALCPLVIASVTEARREVARQLKYLAEHDAMTGATNRRAFHSQSSRMIEDLRASRQPSALLILDIDHFKSINDRYGHVTGDQVIIRVVHCVNEELSRQGMNGAVVGRLGGEEFAVFLPGVDRDALAVIADGIRTACARTEVLRTDGQTVSMTLSLGGVWQPSSESGLDDLIQTADAALYRAKHAGRNKVELTGG